jgi:dihydroorotate dehydrogenase
MYQLIRPLLFRMNPEQVHRYTLGLLKLAGDFAPARALLRKMYELTDARLEVEAFGLKFKNPVGLAAGYDKDGKAVRGLSCLGFGHIEVGTLTPKPQAGNPLPRIHRVPGAEALINNMGFPNIGIDALHVHRNGANVGINIGKGKGTPLEEAAEEYVALLRRAHPQADYIALNVSSPNTLGLRMLQSRAYIEELLAAVTAERNRLTPHKPVLVKIAPDLVEEAIDVVLAAVLRSGIDGVIATNTTVKRDGLPEFARGLPGGMSGAPLRERSTAVIRYVERQTDGKLPIVGVGGITSPADALAKFDAGACLVQIYTGLIYRGPSLPRRINAQLLRAIEGERVSRSWWLPAVQPARNLQYVRGESRYRIEE